MRLAGVPKLTLAVRKTSKPSAIRNWTGCVLTFRQALISRLKCGTLCQRAPMLPLNAGLPVLLLLRRLVGN
jgi:hypothetical protein